MKRGEVQKLSNILENILKRARLGADPDLVDAWNEAVGPLIARHTCPSEIRRGTLFIRVSSPIWIQQLQFMKNDILCRLSESNPDLADCRLHFSVGEIPSRLRD